ncbi:MAG: DnaB-like helicase N-terminal domain-containing protein [Actinomycetota bacterium]
MSNVRKFPTRKEDTDQPPPHDLYAEQSVLGAMLIDEGARKDLLSQLVTDDFYSTPNQLIFKAVRTSMERNAAADAVLVIDALKQSGDLDQVGGSGYLATLLSSPPLIANASHYATIVRDKAKDRRLIDAALHAIRKTRDGAHAAQYLREQLNWLEIESEAEERRADQDVQDFLATPEDEYDFIVPDLLERGDRLILTGPEGFGKSTMLRQFGVQCAAGIHPFALQGIPPIKVLLIDLENPQRLLKRELRPLVLSAGDKLKRDQLVVISREQGLNLLDEIDRSWFASRIAANAPDLVITGPIYKMVTLDGARPEEVVTTTTRTIDELRAKHHFSILLEAHTPLAQGPGKRPIRPIDSSAWLRWPEFGLHIDENGVIRHFRGARDERQWPKALKRGGAWPWTVDESAEIEGAIDVTEVVLERAETIVSLLRQRGPQTKRSLRKEIGGGSGVTDKALSLCLQQHRIFMNDEGLYEASGSEGGNLFR